MELFTTTIGILGNKALNWEGLHSFLLKKDIYYLKQLDLSFSSWKVTKWLHSKFAQNGTVGLFGNKALNWEGLSHLYWKIKVSLFDDIYNLKKLHLRFSSWKLTKWLHSKTYFLLDSFQQPKVGSRILLIKKYFAAISFNPSRLGLTNKQKMWTNWQSNIGTHPSKGLTLP